MCSNAYEKIVKQQENEVIIPNGVQEDVSTVVVADNIDREEETMSGKNSSFTKGGCKLLLMVLLNYFFILLCWKK